jgi:hypothetical protein
MANASSTPRHLALEQTSGAEEAPLHRSDISTETGKGLFGQLPKLAVTTPTHLCAAVERLRQCGYDANGVDIWLRQCPGLGGRAPAPYDLIRGKVYAAAISRVARTFSFSTLQSAGKLASHRTCGNRPSAPRPHRFS